MQWGLVATDGAFHPWHIDSDGFGTFVEIQTGRKWWVLARPRGNDPDFSDFARIDTFLGGIDTTAPNLDRWELEAVLLEPGTRLVMRPNTPHLVYTFGHTIAYGGHFYSTSVLRDTAFGVMHTFVGSSVLTNTSHYPSRHLLRRMVYFFHESLVRGSSCSAAVSAHLFDLSDPQTPFDLIIFCSLIMLLTALDFQTYESTEVTSELSLQNPMSLSGHLGAAYTQGMAMELINWIFHHFDVKNLQTGDVVHYPYVEIFSQYLISLSRTLPDYMAKALLVDMHGPQGCTVESFEDKLENAISQLPKLEMIKFRYEHETRQFSTLAPASHYLFTLKKPAGTYKPLDNITLLVNGSSNKDQEYMTHCGVDSDIFL
ncbi:hypothetical protein NLJ89_g10083 [Agrocybe chaxingu]|uniref:JmjC domain-containing protein n=1 Tax=Agrocybe chaxingu TaxID=84603 RepID=A0A9W8JS01_9AGAR|nr:hypothetical protein NLJ89_g10083 [Agrocybe chaxingu]